MVYIVVRNCLTCKVHSYNDENSYSTQKEKKAKNYGRNLMYKLRENGDININYVILTMEVNNLRIFSLREISLPSYNIYIMIIFVVLLYAFINNIFVRNFYIFNCYLTKRKNNLQSSSKRVAIKNK